MHDTPLLVAPDDEFNRQLVANVHPSDWVNPSPHGKYDLVVIGAGTAGLVTAAGAAGLGAKVALVERHLMGGDCLNVGCVPSKALLRAARSAAAVRAAGELGVSVPDDVQVDFPAVMQRMRRLRASISPHDSAQRFRDLGVDVFLGEASFAAGGDAIQVGDSRLSFKRAVLCTGARAALPDVPGLAAAKPLTNETVFSLTELPARLAVIGGGPIGAELSQAFARFGAQVALLEKNPRILPRDDADAAAVVEAQLRRDGVEILCGTELVKVETHGALRRVFARTGREAITRDVDAILVAAGRAPNVEGLNLEAAGVAYDSRGVTVDDFLRTTNSRIYAAGDICSRFKFTHAADFQARLVIQNALFFGRAKASRLIIPWCTYTSPELAQVGLTTDAATRQGIKFDVYQQDFSAVDRAILDGQTDGFVKVLTTSGSDRILGATIVAGHAGDLISEITLAMNNGLGLKKLAATIHPYPTQAEAIRKLGDQYNRTRLTPLTKRVLKWIIGMRR